MKIEAVVDTNVLISGIFWKGKPFEILRAWQAGQFALVVSPPIMEEYRRVLAEMTSRYALPVISPILELIELHAKMVKPISFGKPICTDPDDDKFLEAAVAADATYVVSGDKALLRIKKYLNVAIVKPAQFLPLLKA